MKDFFTDKPMIVSCIDYTPFVAELDPAGNLLYGTCVPAAGLSGYGIAIDASGNAYIAGDGGFVMKIDQTPSIVYSTTLSSTSGVTTAFGIAVDSSNNAYVTGATGTGFPLVNPIDSTGPGAFLTKLSADGTSLVYSTYLTGSIGGLSGNWDRRGPFRKRVCNGGPVRPGHH